MHNVQNHYNLTLLDSISEISPGQNNVLDTSKASVSAFTSNLQAMLHIIKHHLANFWPCVCDRELGV